MHPELRLANLAELPIRYRRYASAAANGSLPDLWKLAALNAKNPCRERGLFLPIFYCNLDPAQIPSPSQLDSETAIDPNSSIARAIMSLDGIADLRQHGYPWEDATAAELWPRIWSWIYFLNLYVETAAPFIPLSSEETWEIYMKLIIDFQGNPATTSLVSETPGVRAVVAQAWAGYLNEERNVDEPGVIKAVQFINRDTRSAHPPNLQEYIEGAGGLGRFASWVVYHIDRALRRQHGYPVSNTTVFLLKGLLRLLVESDDGQGNFATALLSRGIIGTITFVLCSFESSMLEGADDVRSRCFTILTRRFDLSPSYPSVAESLKSNLVHVITTCAQNDLGMDDFLRTLLQRILPRSLISHTVLSALDRAVDEDTDLLFPQPDSFRDPELLQLWDRFNKTALRNVRLFQAYNKGASTSVFGCDSTKCEQIRRKNEFKRCSSCRAVYYCSTACQAVDWYEDGHRDVCSHLRNLRLAEPENLSARERSFLYVLVHYNHQNIFRRSCMHKIAFMYQNPGEQFYLLFDYTQGFDGPQVLPIGSPPDPNPSEASAAQWADQVARAARSGGRLDLVVVLVADGERVSRRMVPVRSPTSALHDGLSQIAARIPPGADLAVLTPQVREDVTSLLRERKERGEHRSI
ncbi:MYND-type domain-containing protein [Mycena venus]|uniref:MYND-type domain-containing protein n=1 Tax=Mycena venus TaxID=2733690 RepID=A0A8H7CNB7_9AGAR|nr:MYND-type domain-containing protein [Mycena venus]